jgi:hypothetical protein
MRTIATYITVTTLLGLLFGLCGLMPAQAFPLTPPHETLAGLSPGINTVADASRLYGDYDTVLPGLVAGYAGGPHGTHSYRWTDGTIGRGPGFSVETEIGSPVIAYVVDDDYPGFSTSRGLTALVPEERVLRLYGVPDYAYDVHLNSDTLQFRELYYVNCGLLVVLGQMEGRPNWTVEQLILTYPTYLLNAVAARAAYAASGVMSDAYVEDITGEYTVRTRHVSF